jgi:hypothetical protein
MMDSELSVKNQKLLTKPIPDVSASFSVGSLEILLATIFLLYGINAGIAGRAAVVLRSTGFWFPLFVGFVCVQIIGTKNLLAARHEDLKRRLKRTRKTVGEPPKQKGKKNQNRN